MKLAGRVLLAIFLLGTGVANAVGELKDFERQLKAPERAQTPKPEATPQPALFNALDARPRQTSLWLLPFEIFFKEFTWFGYLADKPATDSEREWFNDSKLTMRAGSSFSAPNIHGPLAELQFSKRHVGLWAAWETLYQDETRLSFSTQRLVFVGYPSMNFVPSLTVGRKLVAGRESQEGLELGIPLQIGVFNNGVARTSLFVTFFPSSTMWELSFAAGWDFKRISPFLAYQMKAVGGRVLHGPALTFDYRF